MATETLHIKVREDGSRKAANEFRELTKEILRAGTAVARFKKQIKSIGSSGLTREINRAKGATDELTKATKKSASGVKKLGKAAAKTKGPLQNMATQLSQVRGVLFSLGAIAAGRTFLSFSDQFQNMQNRIRLVTNSSEEFAATQSRLEDIAKSTRQSLTATTETYVRLRKATKDTGISSERLFGVMTTLNQMMAISGATSQEAEQSIRQLSQAFSKGKLDGDEFRTVSEAMPDILDALQESLGATRGELRDMSEAGQLTTSVLINAFEGVSQKVGKDFANSVEPLSQSWQLLKDEVLKAVGELNASTGAIGLVQKAMKLLANNIGLVVIGIKAFVAIMIGRMLFAIPAVAVAIRGQLVDSLRRLVLWLGSVDTAAGITARSLGSMAVAAAAAFTAGFKLGELLEDVTGGAISDALAGIDDSSRAKTIEESAAIIRKSREGEIKQLERLRKFGAFVNKEQIDEDIKKIKTQLKVLDSGVAIQVARREEAKAAREAAEAAEELRRAETKAFLAREKNVKSLKDLFGAFRPAIKAQREMNDAQRQFLDLAFELDLSSAQIQGGLDEISAAFDDRLRPVEKEIEKNEELLEIVSKRTEKEREAAKIVKESVDFIQKAKGLAQATLIEGTTTFEDPAIQSQLERLVASREALAKRNAQIQRGGRGSSLKRDLDRLVQSFDPVLKAQREFIKGQETLEKAERKGLITSEKALEIRRKLAASTFDAREPQAALATLMERELQNAKLSTEQLQRLNAQREIEKELMKTTGAERHQLDEALVNHLTNQKLEIANLEQLRDRREAASEAIVSEKEALKELQFQIAAINAEREKGLTQAEADKLILEERLKQFEGMENQLRSVVDGTVRLTEVEKERARIDNLRIAGEKLIAQIARDRNLSQQEEAELRRNLTILIKQQTEALDEKIRKDAEEAKKAAERAAQTKNSLKSLTSGIKELLSPEAINRQQIDFITSAFTSLEDQIVSFTTTGKFDFKAMVDSMLADLTRLIFRMTIARAISRDIANGGSGVGGAFAGGGLAAAGLIGAATLIPGIVEGGLSLLQGAFAHGGQFKVPRFANGGEFQVGGAGGPDTQLVQFLASPGENVRITNPGQSRLDNRAAQAAQQAPQEGPTILNIIDPSEFSAALASPAGERAVINTIQQNPELIKRFLK